MQLNATINAIELNALMLQCNNSMQQFSHVEAHPCPQNMRRPSSLLADKSESKYLDIDVRIKTHIYVNLFHIYRINSAL